MPAITLEQVEALLLDPTAVGLGETNKGTCALSEGDFATFIADKVPAVLDVITDDSTVFKQPDDAPAGNYIRFRLNNNAEVTVYVAAP